MRLKDIIASISAGLLVFLAAPVGLMAQSASPNFRVDESFFGIGGEMDAQSDNFRARQSLGELGVGQSSSDNFQARGGANNPDEPVLEVLVSSGNMNMGVVSQGGTTSASASIRVRSYLSSGYVMQLVGAPPQNSGHTLEALVAPTASRAGTEQFGVNLRQNTEPVVGAEPEQFPDANFSYGTPTPDYNTPNLFKYISGDIIATSPRETGETHYTLSVILNISGLTPGGQYNTDLTVVVTAGF